MARTNPSPLRFDRFVAALVLWLSPFLVLPVLSEQQNPAVVSTTDITATTTATGTATAATAAPTSGWSGCVDPTNGYQKVTIGQPTPICLVLANNADWTTEMTYLRLNFRPKADEYSRFHVPDSFVQLVGRNNNNNNNPLGEIFTGNITVHAESQTALSFQKQYYDGNDKVFPYLTAIISVDEGAVTGIIWDDACVFCGPNECLDNTYGYNGNLATKEDAKQSVGACYSTVAACRASTKGATSKCDLELYVVWTGTDANGKDFTSSANRFSAFPAQSWGDRVRLNIDVPDWMENINPFDDKKTGDPAAGVANTTPN
mmetsp:Transcript_7392/g.21514  ORF Transcript_7392/g.21514 Transcript_7392/m.21514 type:complete len:316 (+) Transcript_7392:289-1236(+)